MVVWETGAAGSQTAHGQVFDAGGNKVGSELTFAGTSSEQVQVSDTNDGTFYVSWSANPQPNNNGVITVQQFSDSTGIALGAATTDLSLFAPPPANTIGSLSMTIGPDGSYFDWPKSARGNASYRLHHIHDWPLGVPIPQRGRRRNVDSGQRHLGEHRWCLCAGRR